MNHSRRYQEVKENIKKFLKDNHSLDEVFTFLQSNNKEKIRDIKVSFSLDLSKKRKISFREKVVLPHSFPTKGKIAVIKDSLPTSIIDHLNKNEKVELLSVEDIHQKIIAKGGNKLKKRSQWGFEKIIICPQNEKEFKSPEKLSPKLFSFIARRVLLNEDVLKEVENFQKGEKELRTDKGGNIHAVIGKVDFSNKQLTENFESLYKKIISPFSKGKVKDKLLNLKKITFSTTMGPGLRWKYKDEESISKI